MSLLKKTAMETAVLTTFHESYKAQGFPSVEEIQIQCRENTGGGRYVDLESEAQLLLNDGYLDLKGRYVTLDGLPNGMMVVVFVKDKRVRFLEFTTYGGDYWDGVERNWSIV